MKNIIIKELLPKALGIAKTTLCSILVSATIISYCGVTAMADDEKRIGALDWFKTVQYIFARDTDALVTDVETGKSFYVKRTYGTNHADVEPLTKEDADIIKEIWGGWSWERRAVTVQTDEHLIAGSMTAYPHAGVDSKVANITVSKRSGGYGKGTNLDAVKDNGVDGHMDIHFLNSRTHTTNIKQKAHQDKVKEADKYLLTATQE